MPEGRDQPEGCIWACSPHLVRTVQGGRLGQESGSPGSQSSQATSVWLCHLGQVILPSVPLRNVTVFLQSYSSKIPSHLLSAGRFPKGRKSGPSLRRLWWAGRAEEAWAQVS